jgi:hypothetical protein
VIDVPLKNFSGTGGQDSLDQVYAFAATVTNFIDNTEWMQGAFPFGMSMVYFCSLYTDLFLRQVL